MRHGEIFVGQDQKVFHAGLEKDHPSVTHDLPRSTRKNTRPLA